MSRDRRPKLIDTLLMFGVALLMTAALVAYSAMQVQP